MTKIYNKLGFLLSGIINNTGFILILSCAYSLSVDQEYINPALILIFNILPGFFTQLAYPYLLYNFDIKNKILVLFITHTISSILLIVTKNIYVILCAISFISINSYLGELSFLSLTSNYNKETVKYWSIGSGFSGLFSSGLYIVLKLFTSNQIIFIINYILYVVSLLLVIKLLNINLFRKNINQQINKSELKGLTKLEPEINETNITEQNIEPITIGESAIVELEEPITIGESAIVELEEEPIEQYIESFENIKVVEIEYLEDNHLYDKVMIKLKIIFKLFIDSYPIWLSYFFGYLIDQSLIPLLVLNEKWYSYLQFISQIGKFCGRTLGNYINIKGIKKIGLIHLYNIIIVVLYLSLIFNKRNINNFVLLFLNIICATINGITYPLIYNNIYENYKENNTWSIDRAMGSIGQFTTFFTIFSSIIGYFLQIFI